MKNEAMIQMRLPGGKENQEIIGLKIKRFDTGTFLDSVSKGPFQYDVIIILSMFQPPPTNVIMSS